jgi:mannose-6-phosphate isomerase
VTSDAAYNEVIFLEPVFLPKIWGGSRLHEFYGRPPSKERIGESIVVSGHAEADCLVRGGRFDGKPLSFLWSAHRDLFGALSGDSFPLQVKLIDATEDLSVQVHPDAQYARDHGDGEEKNECWYVLAPSHSRRIVIGHNARSREELTRLVEEGRWDELVRQIDMNDGDSYFIPAGTAHCILAGSLIYEVMQASNTTYRLYDYDRLDGDGKKRDLHIEQALAVLNVPDAPPPARSSTVSRDGVAETVCIRNEFFSLSKWEVTDRSRQPVNKPFLLIGVMGGSGHVNGAPVARGDHFVVPNAVRELHLIGPLSLMVTSL